MTATDTVQLVLGLLIFPLLIGHIAGNVIIPLMTDARQTYFSGGADVEPAASGLSMVGRFSRRHPNLSKQH